MCYYVSHDDACWCSINIFHIDHSCLHVWILCVSQLVRRFEILYCNGYMRSRSLKIVCFFRFVESEHLMVEYGNDLLRGRFVICFVLICYLSYCFWNYTPQWSQVKGFSCLFFLCRFRLLRWELVKSHWSQLNFTSSCLLFLCLFRQSK